MIRGDFLVQLRFIMCFLCVVPVKRGFTSTLDLDSIYNSKTISNTGDIWSVHVLKDRVSVSGLDQTESGFDLTDDEMKKFKLWPEGIVPYYIDDFSYDKVLRDRIRNFLDVAGGTTGLHFRELPSPPEDDKARWVFFINRQALLGCSDHTPATMTNEGVQKVVLGYDCMSQEGELAEAVLAIVGVPPQHNSPDRDDYITVETKNIVPDKQYLFKKLQDNEWLFHDLQYDFSSAGHFNFHKHTVDGQATIVPKKPVDMPVGENDGFSYTDVIKIRMLYNYISRKKSKGIKGPECDKLFKPGRNFSQFKPDPEESIKPRSKPNKYLGLPDDAPREDLKEESIDKPKEESKEEANEDSKEDLIEGNDNEDGEIKEVESENNNESNGAGTEAKATEQQTTKKVKREKLLYKMVKNKFLKDLSDYDTKEKMDKLNKPRRPRKPRKNKKIKKRNVNNK